MGGQSGGASGAAASQALQHTVSHMLGELTWLLTQSPTHRHFTFADMEWMILPPLMLEQYRVFRASPSAVLEQQGGGGAGQTQASDGSCGGSGASNKNVQPVGYATWAYLSEEAAAKLNAGAASGRGARLRPDEWKSGESLWLVDLVTPTATPDNRVAEACLADLLQGPLKGKTVKFHRTDPETGTRDVVELAG
ncbi:MAG: toxin-activating lysine-acyltransferase [Sphingomonadales bacterium]